MGLDMYLEAESRLPIEHNALISNLFGLGDWQSRAPWTPNHSITFDIGYWRKGHEVHKWFVDNVQNGVDDWQSYYVSNDDLQKLRDQCANILRNRKTKVLLLGEPASFYQPQQDLELYFNCIERTIHIMDNAINYFSDSRWIIKYRASW